MCLGGSDCVHWRQKTYFPGVIVILDKFHAFKNLNKIAGKLLNNKINILEKFMVGYQALLSLGKIDELDTAIIDKTKNLK